MFVYSLDGLEIGGDTPDDVEIEENETTARSGVYQVLARLLAAPDDDSHAAAIGGEWPQRLTEAAELLAYPFDFGSASVPDTVNAEDFQAEYLRLFEVGDGTNGPGAPLFGGVYGDGDRMKRLEEVVRFYEYFGLHTSAEDPRPADHLTTEMEFMQYLAFKEAASPSPRLQASYRRAQDDFLERQLTPWLPQLAERAATLEPMPFWQWAVSTISDFADADARYVRQLAD
jgi:DMSO reductase family type II enzyme chaperone